MKCSLIKLTSTIVLGFLVSGVITFGKTGSDDPQFLITTNEKVNLQTFHEKLGEHKEIWAKKNEDFIMYQEPVPKLISRRHNLRITVYGVSSFDNISRIASDIISISELAPYWYGITLKFYEEEVWIQRSASSRGRGEEHQILELTLRRTSQNQAEHSTE